MKRAFDIVMSAAGLLLSAPLWLLIAAAVKAHDGGPVLFAQERVGRGGQVFRAWKFRSMIPDAERQTGPVQAAKDDPRVTPIGRWLRRRALDELPQLWNILAGDMSFVGPRPLRPQESSTTAEGPVLLSAIPGYEERHRIRPGLTGTAQVYAARDATLQEKFALDCQYVRNASMLLDLKLFIISIWISSRGAWESVHVSDDARGGARL